MTDIFTGQEKQQPLKTRAEGDKIAPEVLFKRLFSSQECIFQGKYEPRNNLKNRTIVHMYRPEASLDWMVI